MKKSSMFGAVALSAVMAMGAIPAFAAPAPGSGQLLEGVKGYLDSDGEGNPDDASNNVKDQFTYKDGAGDPSAETNVNVFYNAAQIQATIPLEVTIVATGTPTTPGEIIAPTNYRIENNSTTLAIKVTEVAAKAKTVSGDQFGWNLTTIQSDGTTPKSGYVGDLELKLQPSSYTAAASTYKAVDLHGIESGVELSNISIGEDWKLDAKTGEVDNENQKGNGAILNLDMTGKSWATSEMNGTGAADSKTAVDQAFTITYTVTAA